MRDLCNCCKVYKLAERKEIAKAKVIKSLLNALHILNQIKVED